MKRCLQHHGTSPQNLGEKTGIRVTSLLLGYAMRRAADDYTKLSSVSTPSYYSPSTLLGKLMQSLNKHMRQSTLQHEPSLGTLLWRSGDSTADLLLRQLNATKKTALPKQTAGPEGAHPKATDVDYLVPAATILKGDIHQVSEKFREQTRQQDFANFDVSDIIKVLPARLEFFAIVTETKSQQAQRELSVNPGWSHDKHYVPEGVGDIGHRHKLRTLFGVCHAVYTHDDRCGYPIHTLLGEAVHGLGGSDELMRILNRFGITSSLSKIRDYEMDHVYIRLKYGWENVFTDDAFCFASVDNVDKSSAHASVKAAGGARGIHATSYQIVEPKPRGLTSSPEKTDMPSTSSGIRPSRTQIVLPTTVSVNMINEIRRKARPQVISWDRSKKNAPYGSLKDFEIQPKEDEAIRHATTTLLGYAISKNSASATPARDSRLLFPDLNLICPMPNASVVEKSSVFYIGVLNEHADNINTIKEVVETLHEEIVVQRNLESLAVVGDGKTFFHLAKLKQEYSAELEWMIPFPGDWHTLKNLQPVLMKIYWHAGLSDLASTVHKGATLTSVFQCSNFRRSHDFLILAWEALLRTQILSFMKYVDEHPELGLEEMLMAKVAKKLDTIKTLDDGKAPQAMLDVWEIVGGEEFGQVFTDFRHKMSANETYKLWDSFIHRDALAYILLFVAIRTGNWHLRIGALKKMAPLFHAFDRPTYLRLIPRHLLDVLQMPNTMLDHLQNGGFVASLKGIPGRSVAADECHEMKINKEVKMAMAKPVPDMMDRVALLLPYRATAIERLKNQVSSGEVKGTEMSNASELVNVEGKVKIYMAKLDETLLSSYRPKLDVSPLYTFSGQFADAAQREDKDMMHFYEVGEQSLKSYISTRLLNVPRVDVPHRQRRLKTFIPKRKRQTKVSLKAKNTKIVTRCLRKIIVHSKNTHQPIEHLGQFIELPLAIANPKGSMIHGNKANSTSVYRRRYSEAFTKALPAGWKPECVILEGMFLINSSPMRSAQVFRDYTYHLLSNFILPRFALGACEVHVVFDHPGRNGTSPKDLDRLRPEDGSEFLREGQRLVSAAGFDEYMIDKAKSATKFAIEEESNFSSNHEESDSRVWLHCLNTPHSRVLIYSPDTDTYHIGLRSLYSPDGTMKKDAVVQLSMSIDSNEYLSLSKLVNFLRSDPDLDALAKDQLPTTMQTIYIASGCDYTSFFYGCGKASFLSTFFQHANFITGSDEEGTLADNDIHSEKGLLAFYRLVGSLYYKKFSSVMPSDFKTPKQLFQSFKTEDTDVKIHHNWLNSIREHSWEKVDSEEEVMPSNEALLLHWQRTCWVAHLWGQAGNHQVNHAPITEYGYCQKDNVLCIEWDTPNNIKPDDTVYESEEGEYDLFDDPTRWTDGASSDESDNDSGYQTFDVGAFFVFLVGPVTSE
ncbi:hypothetical protein HOLleu_00456 [Holothuria leucospilota]|uniref:DUF6589 domain-containing protein n=1 Tax=Holothuria leucospilota TaxID=206669 RepID=A0A9Q1HJP1_HOLLE|nr:hypothetical protein HOLleu_00456 [Holothuria leucospilota]